MAKLLVCVDGSLYADNICANAAWAAQRMGASVELLHVLRRHSDYQAPADHTGAIGVDTRSELLEELTKVDEERGRLDQKKGKIILEHGAKVLRKFDVANVNTVHRRGSLVDAILELEHSVDMIFLGKRGEHADLNSTFLGSNLEKVARAVHKPLFVVSSVVRPIKKFVVAYDGKDSVLKAVEFISRSPLLKGLECHLLAVEAVSGQTDVAAATAKLQSGGFQVVTKTEQSTMPDQVITSYVDQKGIDLLVTGAYSHSRMRSILLGSTTASLIKSCKVPLLLFR